MEERRGEDRSKMLTGADAEPAQLVREQLLRQRIDRPPERPVPDDDREPAR
jgi:hypothetical protein